MKHVLPCIYNLSFSLTVSCSSLIFQRTAGSRYLKNQHQRTVSSGYFKTNQNQRTCWFWVFQNPHKVLVHPTPKASYTTGFRWMVHWWLLVQSGSPNWSVKLWIGYGYIHIQSICFSLPVGHSEPGPTGAP